MAMFLDYIDDVETSAELKVNLHHGYSSSFSLRNICWIFDCETISNSDTLSSNKVGDIG